MILGLDKKNEDSINKMQKIDCERGKKELVGGIFKLRISTVIILIIS